MKLKYSILIIILLILKTTAVNAVLIKEEVIDGYYILDNETKNKFELKFYTEEYESKVLFNTKFYNELTKSYFSKKESEYDKFLNISLDNWYYIKNVLYYGYGYENHNDLNWYIATQIIIYEELEKNLEIICDDGILAKDILNTEYDEIKSLATKSLLLPSYFKDEINFNIGDYYSLQDLNDTNNYYGLIPTKTLKVIEKNGEKFLTSTEPIIADLYLGYRNLEYTKNTIYFNNKISFVDRSGLSIRHNVSKVYVHGTKIKLKNYNEENEPIPNSVFSIYNSNNKKILSLSTDNAGAFETDFLPKDEYYVIQERVDQKYQINTTPENIKYIDYGISELTIINKLKNAKIDFKICLNKNIDIKEIVILNDELKEEVQNYIYNDNVINFSKLLNKGSYKLLFVLDNGETSILEFSINNEKIINLNLNIELQEETKINDEIGVEKPDTKEDYIILDVPATGIDVKPIFLVLSIIFLILSLISYAKK